jgi:hypothetical protein
MQAKNIPVGQECWWVELDVSLLQSIKDFEVVVFRLEKIRDYECSPVLSFRALEIHNGFNCISLKEDDLEKLNNPYETTINLHKDAEVFDNSEECTHYIMEIFKDLKNKMNSALSYLETRLL